MPYRDYTKDDYTLIHDMLREEDVPVMRMMFDQKGFYTKVVEDEKGMLGFFTFTTSHGFPLLQHFCVGKEMRSPKSARDLVKAFCYACVHEMNSTKAIISSPVNGITGKFVKYYFGELPYATQNDGYEDVEYYLVEV